MTNPLFELSWKKLIGSFKSSSGLVIPMSARTELMCYIVAGIIPDGYLKHMLVRDFDRLFLCPKEPLEEARIQVMWEFITTYFPGDAWGSEEAVRKYSLKIRNGFLTTEQRRYLRLTAVDGHIDVD